MRWAFPFGKPDRGHAEAAEAPPENVNLHVQIYARSGTTSPPVTNAPDAKLDTPPFFYLIA